MPNIALIDAGPLIAVFNSNDSFHGKIKERLKEFRLQHGRFITTWPVISEAAYMLHTHTGLKAQTGLFKWVIEEYLEIFDLKPEHIRRVLTLQEKYHDLPMEFAVEAQKLLSISLEGSVG
ncbi:MAG: PIN domain-containing protein [Candidatus Omnitrophica bacterium]|nr:PIN domain-containing protein [Candidatus Omnitrophota bacterium]